LLGNEAAKRILKNKTVFSVGSVQRSFLEDSWRYESSQFSVGDGHGKFVVEEELEVSL
jgi:hypothetical protein